MIARVLEKSKAEAEVAAPLVAWLGKRDLLHGDKLLPKVVEAASLEVVLARVVGIESRPADIRRSADVVDGDRVIALLADERDEGLRQHGAAARDAAVDRLPAS